VEIANNCKHRFAVVGGWSPFFLNNALSLHPGSKDVDLLFDNATQPKSLENVVRAFLDRGYLLSAKHEFQLLRVAQVGAEQLVFNVDLLHPNESAWGRSIGRFVDQIELPLPDSEFAKSRFVKSITLPDSQFIFDYDRVALIPLTISLPDGGTVKCELPIADESAILVTKSKSMAVPKRPRDILDIFMAVAYCRDRIRMADFFKDILQRESAGTYNTLFQIAVNIYLDEEADNKITQCALHPELIPQRGSDVILEFLVQVGINVEEAKSKALKQRETSIRATDHAGSEDHAKKESHRA
jgi:hypothetical protein